VPAQRGIDIVISFTLTTRRRAQQAASSCISVGVETARLDRAARFSVTAVSPAKNPTNVI
jgi:hypothetical protein